MAVRAVSRKPSRAEREHWAFAHGADADFLRGLTHQPSCLDGSFSEYHDGEGRNVACHIRMVKAGAGTGLKPPLSALPLTDAQHRLTHQHGNSHFRPAEWWEARAEEDLRRWAEGRRPDRAATSRSRPVPASGSAS